MRILTGAAAIAAFAFAGAAFAQPDNVEVVDGAFVTTDGMPLYTFARDSENNSACVGGCAEAWPPLAAADDAEDEGDWTATQREDGIRQWAYKGMPLYTYARDTAGEAPTGVSDTWPLAME